MTDSPSNRLRFAPTRPPPVPSGHGLRDAHRQHRRSLHRPRRHGRVLPRRARASRCCSRTTPSSGWAGFQAGDVSIYLIAHRRPETRRGDPGRRAARVRVVRLRRSPTSTTRSPSSTAKGVAWAGEIVESRLVSLPQLLRPRGQPAPPHRARPARARARPRMSAGRVERRASRGDRSSTATSTPSVPSIETLFPYLDDHWREVATRRSSAGPTDNAHPPSAATSLATRAGRSRTAGGRAPSRTCARSVLDPPGVETAILVCAYAAEAIKNPDAAVALSPRRQHWLAAEWLDRERGCAARSSCRGFTRAARSRRSNAAAENPRFVQVVLPVRSFAPYGNRIWWPAARGGHAPRARRSPALRRLPAATRRPRSGWPTTYIEEYVDMPSAFQSQLMSLVAEGVFDRFPGLRVLLPRKRLCLAAEPHVALRPAVARPASRDAVDATGTVGVHPRARPGHDPAVRRARSDEFPRVVRPHRLGRDALLSPPTTHTGSSKPPTLAFLRSRTRPRRRPSWAAMRDGFRPGARDAMAASSRPGIPALVDCDVHNALPTTTRCTPYMPADWRDAPRRAHPSADRRFARSARTSATAPISAPSTPGPPSARPGSTRGRRAAAPPALRPRVHSDAAARSRGTSSTRCSTRCSGSARCSTSSSPAVMARAANDWLAEEWLDARPAAARVDRGPLRGPGRSPPPRSTASRADPRFVQVLVLSRTNEPLGQRQVLADLRGLRAQRAADRESTTAAGVATRSHRPASRATTSRTRPRWRPRSRRRSSASSARACFDHFPGLQVVLIEGGFAWLPRPHVAARPGLAKLRGRGARGRPAALGDHPRVVLVSTQPMEEPEPPEQFHVLLEQTRDARPADVCDRLPALGFRRARPGVPRPARPRVRNAIMRENAPALYGFADRRPGGLSRWPGTSSRQSTRYRREGA